MGAHRGERAAGAPAAAGEVERSASGADPESERKDRARRAEGGGGRRGPEPHRRCAGRRYAAGRAADGGGRGATSVRVDPKDAKRRRRSGGPR